MTTMVLWQSTTVYEQPLITTQDKDHQ